jgi:hypothetical protein
LKVLRVIPQARQSVDHKLRRHQPEACAKGDQRPTDQVPNPFCYQTFLMTGDYICFSQRLRFGKLGSLRGAKGLG